MSVSFDTMRIKVEEKGLKIPRMTGGCLIDFINVSLRFSLGWIRV